MKLWTVKVTVTKSVKVMVKKSLKVKDLIP